jgi:hypothetical protein
LLTSFQTALLAFKARLFGNKEEASWPARKKNLAKLNSEAVLLVLLLKLLV